MCILYICLSSVYYIPLSAIVSWERETVLLELYDDAKFRASFLRMCDDKRYDDHRRIIIEEKILYMGFTDIKDIYIDV